MATIGDDELAAALAAFEQAGEQVKRCLAGSLLSILHAGLVGALKSVPALRDLLPEIITDNPQLRGLGDDPLVFRAGLECAALGIWITDPFGRVPHIATDVQLVVKHWPDAGTTPGLAPHRLDAVGIQSGRNLPVPTTIGKVFEDTTHHLSLLGIDLPLHRYDYWSAELIVAFGILDRHVPIAVGPTTGVVPMQRLTGQTPVRLVAQVLKVDVVDDPSDPGDDLVGLAGAVVAITDAYDPDAPEPESF